MLYFESFEEKKLWAISAHNNLKKTPHSITLQCIERETRFLFVRTRLDQIPSYWLDRLDH